MTRIVALVASSATVATLGGCGLLLIAESDGQGNCDGKGDFGIGHTQSADSVTHTIWYDGPDDVSLVLAQGLYIDNVADIEGGTVAPDGATGVFVDISGQLGDESSAHVLRLDTSDPGWTTTGSGASTHHEFNGTWDELINGQLLGVGESMDPPSPEIDKFMPAIVGVSCDDSVQTGTYTNSASEVTYVDTINIQAATGIYPGHLLLDPMVIDQSVATDTGYEGTAHWPSSNDTRFNGLNLSSIDGVSVVADVPEVPNDTFSELWYQLILTGMGGNSSSGLNLSFPDGMSTTGDFAWNLTVDPGTETGNYLVYLPMAAEVDGEPIMRIAFMNLYFDAENGIAFLDPIGEPDNPDLSTDSTSELADTGFSSTSGILGALTLIVVGCAAAIHRRTR
ncbi:MAG: hypothetical protein RLZ72_1041 [Actinomycetota bacterium]|jgi:hypothetical protein